LEKLTERFVEPYKVKKIILTNTIELDLPNTGKIHSVVNVSRVYKNVNMSLDNLEFYQVDNCKGITQRQLPFKLLDSPRS